MYRRGVNKFGRIYSQICENLENWSKKSQKQYFPILFAKFLFQESLKFKCYGQNKSPLPTTPLRANVCECELLFFSFRAFSAFSACARAHIVSPSRSQRRSLKSLQPSSLWSLHQVFRLRKNRIEKLKSINKNRASCLVKLTA